MITRVLVVGCGLRPKKSGIYPSEVDKGLNEVEVVNLDKFDLPGVDVVLDLNIIGKPMEYVPHLCPYENHTLSLYFKENHFDRIECEDVLEHVDDIVAVVNDLWRILKPGGVLWIRGPDARFPEQVWEDPTHKRAFASRSFDGWDRTTYDGKHYGYYFHQGKCFFKVTGKVERNKGLEYTLIKEV